MGDKYGSSALPLTISNELFQGVCNEFVNNKNGLSFLLFLFFPFLLSSLYLIIYFSLFPLPTTHLLTGPFLFCFYSSFSFLYNMIFSIYLYINLSFYPSINSSIHPSIYPSIHLFYILSFFIEYFLKPFFFSTSLSIYLSVCLSLLSFLTCRNQINYVYRYKPSKGLLYTK